MKKIKENKYIFEGDVKVTEKVTESENYNDNYAYIENRIELNGDDEQCLASKLLDILTITEPRREEEEVEISRERKMRITIELL